MELTDDCRQPGVAGNFGARYGRATAGTIDVDLREGKRDRWHGAAETNAFDTGLMAEGPVGKAARSFPATVLTGPTSVAPLMSIR